MKANDVALIAAVVVVSICSSLFLSNLVFTPSAGRQQEVEVVDTITTSFSEPDTRYFNKDSVDPTLSIKIGDNQNQNPFNKKVE